MNSDIMKRCDPLPVMPGAAGLSSPTAPRRGDLWASFPAPVMGEGCSQALRSPSSHPTGTALGREHPHLSLLAREPPGSGVQALDLVAPPHVRSRAGRVAGLLGPASRGRQLWSQQTPAHQAPRRNWANRHRGRAWQRRGGGPEPASRPEGHEQCRQWEQQGQRP